MSNFGYKETVLHVIVLLWIDSIMSKLKMGYK